MADGYEPPMEDAGEVARISNGRGKRQKASISRKSWELGHRPRVAYTGEENGFGFAALREFSESVRKSKGRLPDAGEMAVSHFHPGPFEILQALFGIAPRGSGSHGAHDESPGRGRITEIDETYRQPLRTREQALTALVNNSAEYALVPFYQANSGYDAESIHLISKLFSPFGVFQIEASDHYCLAVYEPQVLDIVHSSHPGSGFAHLLHRGRRSWDYQSGDQGEPWMGASGQAAPGARQQAGLNLDRASQTLLRDRVETIFVNPDAARRCRAKLDGLRAAGVKVEETTDWIEPHREMARRVRDTLDSSRMSWSGFNPATGQVQFSSFSNSAGQARPLYAVVLPFDVAQASPEFSVIEDNIEDAVPPKKRFLVVEKNYDMTIFEEVFRLTALRVGYWMQRLLAIREEAESRWPAHDGNTPGIRLLLQLNRNGRTTSTGSLEDHLRRFGVRYSMFQLSDNTMDTPRPKDTSGKPALASSVSPSPVVFDIEFEMSHFHDRGLLRSVIEGFLFRAFDRARFGDARFLAAFPVQDFQLLPQMKRRWWIEGLRYWSETTREGLEALLGPVLGKVLHAPVGLSVGLVTGLFGAFSHLFGLLLKPWFLALLVGVGAAVYYWKTPVGEIVTGLAGRIAAIIARLLGS